MSIKIAFEAKKLPLYFVSHKNGRKTFEIEAFDGVLTASVQNKIRFRKKADFRLYYSFFIFHYSSFIIHLLQADFEESRRMKPLR